MEDGDETSIPNRGIRIHRTNHECLNSIKMAPSELFNVYKIFWFTSAAKFQQSLNKLQRVFGLPI